MNYVENKANLKVFTDSGYQDFAGIAYMGDKPIYRVNFGNKTYLECTACHELFNNKGVKIRVCDLAGGEWIRTLVGKRTKVASIINTGKVLPVYDLIEVGGGHRYFTNSVLSSNCKFFTDEETLINPMCLKRLSDRTKQPMFYVGTTRWYAEPKANKGYLVALDPAVGTGGDFSAIQVFQMPEMVQIAEWSHNNTQARGQVKVLMQTLLYLDQELRDKDDQMGEPEIYWTFENNGIGMQVHQIVQDTGEERFPGILISDGKRPNKGIKGTFTSRNKINECARLKSLLESDRMHLSSANIVKELKFFIAADSGQTYRAKTGEHDDLISASLLIIRMLDYVMRWEDRSTNALREHIYDDEISEIAPLPVVV